MRLPFTLPQDQRDRENLGKFYDTFKDRQWLDRAEIVENHPRHMRKTMELYVSYNPVLEMKDILTFAEQSGFALEIIDGSHKS